MEPSPIPPRIRALFFDLDRTLLTSARTLSDSTARALRACRRIGMGIFVATARPPTLERQLGLGAEHADLLSDGGVFYNGALVRTRGLSAYRFIAPRIVRAIIDAALALPAANVVLQCSGERHAFRYPLPGDNYRLWGMRGLEPPDCIPFPRIGEEPDEVAKMVLFGADLTELHRILLGTVGGAARLYLTDGGAVIQAMGAEVSKKTGVDQAIRMAGLSAEEVAVFGDDVNDREMLAAYPHSVAMGNADPETRSLAAHVTGSNDDEGIAYALGEILRVLPPGATV